MSGCKPFAMKYRMAAAIRTGLVTTGLGEIFQYVVRAKPGYEGRYSELDLRTIQDWIIRRQLLGTPGGGCSSFGGKVKQYEVAIDPNRLLLLWRVAGNRIWKHSTPTTRTQEAATSRKDQCAFHPYGRPRPIETRSRGFRSSACRTGVR